jgi:membrane associated rhomboid family serine protease
MIPITDNLDNLDYPYPQRNPLATYFLIGLILGMFAWELHLATKQELAPILSTWGLVPLRLTTVTQDFFKSGNPAAIVAWFLVASSLIKAMFLHSSFGQVLGNVIFLLVFGRRVESRLGKGKFLLFYLGMGITIGLVQILVAPQLDTPLVGANGAIAAMIGAYLITFPQAQIDTILPLGIVFIPLQLPALFFGFWWFIQQMTYGIGQLAPNSQVNSGFTAYWSHGLGIIVGAIIMKLMIRNKVEIGG